LASVPGVKTNRPNRSMSEFSKYFQIPQRFESLAKGQDLKARVLRGGAWLAAGSFTEQLCRFGRNILLARLLAPEAFGTMAIIMSTTSVIQTLTDVGAREALIQNANGREDTHAGAAWWLAFVRMLSLYLLLFMVAPVIGRFYGNAELTRLLRVAAIGLLLEGAISSRAYVAMKELQFRKWAAINHGGGILGVGITILLSFFIRDVWALVLGYCAESGARCILSFVVCPFRPPIRVDRQAIRDLLKFSQGAFGLSALNLIFARADIFVLGKLYSPSDLGLYAMAVYLVQTPVGFTVNLLAQTLMPTFAHIQDDTARINRTLLQVTRIALLVGMPAVVFLLFWGGPALTLVYGKRYAVCMPALAVASVAALLGIVNGLITIVLYAKGVPQFHRRSVALMAALVVILVYPLAKLLGTVGGQVAVLAAITVGYLLQIERIHKVTALPLLEYFKTFVLACGISGGMAAVCFVSRSVTNLGLQVGVTVCLVSYGIGAAILLRRAGKAQPILVVAKNRV
jgi:O-antigen/teichoic acid export membrane protein